MLTVPQKIALALLRCLLKALALLPLWVLYGLSAVCSLLLQYVVRYRRKVVRRNLTRAYPQYTRRQLRHTERGFYRFFCDYVVETVKLLHVSDDAMRRRFVFRNIDLANTLAQDGRPLFVYLGHYANWEYMTSITLWLDSRLSACQVYHPLSSAVMDAFMLSLRKRFHSVGIAQKQTFRDLLRMKNGGQQPLLGLIADQRPPRRHHDVWTTFLRQPTAIITGSERIGRRMNAHFLYADITVVRRGHYEVTLQEITPRDDDDCSVSRDYMDLLQRSIDRDPRYYLWSHNRWKWSPSDFPSSDPSSDGTDAAGIPIPNPHS